MAQSYLFEKSRACAGALVGVVDLPREELAFLKKTVCRFSSFRFDSRPRRERGPGR